MVSIEKFPPPVESSREVSASWTLCRQPSRDDGNGRHSSIRSCRLVRESSSLSSGTNCLISVVSCWVSYKKLRASKKRVNGWGMKSNLNMQKWRNRQTRTFEVRMGKLVRVQVPLSVPNQLWKEEITMTNTQKIAAIDTRIALLQSRAGKENGNIIKKLLRERRRLAAN